MKAAVFTLGCKVNQYESQAMSEELSKNGYTLVPHNEPADVYIVNSCTVTAESDRKTRQAVRRFKRQNPCSVVVLTGCVPQAYPGISKELPEADILLGNKNNGRLLKALNDYFSENSRLVLTEVHRPGDFFCPSFVSGFYGHTRANIKIEDGCNRFCSYCIIPYARGGVRSKPIDDLRAEAFRLSEAGFCELVLVGINLSAYSYEGSDICDAVEAASAPDNVRRVRLGSLEPDLLTDSVLQRLSNCGKLCPHFHISLQSGCDKTLRMMNRHYTPAEYEAVCDKLRHLFPDVSLTTDVMVGFPGESEEDFEASRLFVERIGFCKVHVFPYSVRAGTRAASFPDKVVKAEKERRARIMTETADKTRRHFLNAQVGKTVEVLAEQQTDGMREGFTRNYTPVRFAGEFRPGELVTVKITGVNGDFCIGDAVNRL